MLKLEDGSEYQKEGHNFEETKASGVGEVEDLGQDPHDASEQPKVCRIDSSVVNDELHSKLSIPIIQAVAVKKMKISGDLGRVLGLTLREAEFLVDLSHSNITKFEGFVEDVSNYVIWLIFPWEDNGNLKDFVSSTDWEIPERISLIYDVARGVEHLHSRRPSICHGDLKSTNILVNSKYRAVITDFGSARRLVPGSARTAGEPTGNKWQEPLSLEATFCFSANTITLTGNEYTLRWAAPELLQEDQCSLQSDIWALGWVMTNSIPFQGLEDTTVITRVIQGDLPPIINDARMMLIQALCSLMARCWSINPSQRPIAEECRKSIEWMPMIIPNPTQTANTAAPRIRSPELLMGLGIMHRRQGDYMNASNFFTEALGICTDFSDRKGEAHALWQLAQLYQHQKDHNKALSLYYEVLQTWTDIGDRQGRADALWGLGEVHRTRGECSEATMFYSEALQIRTDIGDIRGKADALWSLAEVHRARNEYSQAITLYSEVLQIRTDMGDRRGKADALWGLATVYTARDEHSRAFIFYSEGLQIRADIGDRQGRADTLRGLARLHRVRKEFTQAIKFHSDALQISTEIGDMHGRAFALLGLADVYHDLKFHRNAIDRYEEAAEAFRQIGYSNNAASASERAADSHRKLERRRAREVPWISHELTNGLSVFVDTRPESTERT